MAHDNLHPSLGPAYKPTIIVLTKTKAGGEEVDSIMITFNYPHTTKVDVDNNVGGIYILWND